SVANIAYYGLVKLDPLPDSTILEAFQYACHKIVFQEAWQQTEVEKILQTFEANQMKCMPLKGYIIKHLYPQSNMRSMGDVDILVEESKLEKAKDIMLGLGYTLRSEDNNHDIYFKNPAVMIELHKLLISQQKVENLFFYFGSGWDRTRLKAGHKYQYEMSEEDFYIYLLGHMAKHYQRGGTGLRSVMDIWVYKRHYRNQMDWNYITTELEKAGLYEFAKSMESLSEYWFEGKCSDRFYPEIAEYVLSNGTHGTAANFMLTKLLAESKKNNKSFNTIRWKYILRIFFPNRQNMNLLFPSLQKTPFLLPLYWVYRGLYTGLFKRNDIKYTLGNVAASTDAKAKQLEEIRQLSGF
ncbi:MAG: nucleotidyltransferase family protein, partial [Candidatus Eremiobacterota bacterium]